MTTVEKQVRREISIGGDAIEIASMVLALSEGVTEPKLDTGYESSFVYFTGWVTLTEKEQVRIEAYLDEVKAEQETFEAKKLAEEESLVADLRTRRPELFR